MHPSALANMARCVERYLPPGRRYRVVDFGSRISDGQTRSHHDVLSGRDYDYTGVDIRRGRNVDVVMPKPYRVPLPSNSADVILAGQVFEHIPFFWASMLELARVLKPGGHMFVTVPSRGHVHSDYDCWRYYPDGLRAMAAASRLVVREARTDFPPQRSGSRAHAYRKIEPGHYWGDSVGVFEKPAHYPSLEMALIRPVVRWWANRIGDLSGTLGSAAVPESGGEEDG